MPNPARPLLVDTKHGSQADGAQEVEHTERWELVPSRVFNNEPGRAARLHNPKPKHHMEQSAVRSRRIRSSTLVDLDLGG